MAAEASEFHYAEVLDCGHFLEVIAFVPIPARSRVGTPTICEVCWAMANHPPGRGRFFHNVTAWREMEPHEWQGTAAPCPDGRCGPVEDASDFPDVFPMLAGSNIAPHQLGRCARCGKYWRWSLDERRWVEWHETTPL